MAEGNGNEGGEGRGVDYLVILAALARAVSALTDAVEKWSLSEKELRARIESLERRSGES